MLSSSRPQTDEKQVEEVRRLENVIRELRETVDRLASELDERRENTDERVEELEEALRESVRITADREVALDAEVQRRNQLDEKVLEPKNFASVSLLDFSYSFAGGKTRAEIAVHSERPESQVSPMSTEQAKVASSRESTRQVIGRTSYSLARTLRHEVQYVRFHEKNAQFQLFRLGKKL